MALLGLLVTIAIIIFVYFFAISPFSATPQKPNAKNIEQQAQKVIDLQHKNNEQQRIEAENIDK